jgi:hypothetical protein
MSFWLSASLFTSSCLFKKEQPRAFRPPPVVAKVPVELPRPELPDAPDIVADLPPFDPPPLTDPLPQFSPPPPVRTTRPPAANVARPVPPPVETPVAADPPPAPQLGQIFTPDQIRENRQTLDDYLQHVKQAVIAFNGKNLNRDDRATAELVKNFLMQAEQARDKDLAAAVSFAKRADSLAKDLLERLH